MRHELINSALGELGVIELPGAVLNSPRILEYFSEIGHSWVKTDETAWCSAVHNFLHKITGYEYSGQLNARSWLNIGIHTDRPEKGDTVIFWRESLASWKGHVAFWIREEGSYVYTLGGNQNNKYGEGRYPKSRVLDTRIMRLRDE